LDVLLLNPETRSEGFSLLEVLVAVVVLGLAFVTLFELYSKGLHAAEKADRYTEALIHARSLMDETLAASELADGGDRGKLDDFYTYVVEIAGSEVEEGAKRQIFDVWVDVGWNDARQIRLHSRKTLAVDEEETP